VFIAGKGRYVEYQHSAATASAALTDKRPNVEHESGPRDHRADSAAYWPGSQGDTRRYAAALGRAHRRQQRVQAAHAGGAELLGSGQAAIARRTIEYWKRAKARSVGRSLVHRQRQSSDICTLQFVQQRQAASLGRAVVRE